MKDQKQTYSKVHSNLNNIITEVAIAIKTDRSLDKLMEKYGEEQVADALQFITYEQQEIIEVEEDYE